MSRIKELDSLRAFAILAVLLVHFRPVYQPAFNFMALGWSGVDLFFVISGFLITGILWKLRKHPAPFREFYWRRALRIFPPYYLVLVLILLAVHFRGETISRADRIGAWLFLTSLFKGFSIRLMASRLLLRTGFTTIPQSLGFPILQDFKRGLGVFWSLSVEELFYLFWAPIVIKGSKRLIVFCSVVPLIVCPILRGLTHTSASIEYFGFVTHLDSLAAGACLALLFLELQEGKFLARTIERGAFVAAAVSATALFALSWYCGLFRNIELRSTLSFGIFGYTLIAVFCAALVAVCVLWSGSRRTRLLRVRALVFVGTISYMMYLIHVPVFVAVGMGLRWARPFSQAPVVQALLAATITVALATVSWKYYETPILRFKERKFGVSFGGINPSPEDPIPHGSSIAEPSQSTLLQPPLDRPRV